MPITPEQQAELWNMSGLLVGLLIAVGWLSTVIYREYSNRSRPSKCPQCGAWFYRARKERTCGGYNCGRLR